MKEHSIETVKRRQLKFDDAICGSFCKAFYTHDEKIVRKATEYHKHAFKENIMTVTFPVFHIYCKGVTRPIVSVGFRETVSFMNKFDLKTFRDKLKK